MDNKKWTYDSWMKYLYESLNGKAEVKGVVTKFGEIGKRSFLEIDREIKALKKEDKEITEKVRSTYKLEK
tara:strand:+ start:2184 stop:2393 length:210 start_codon:yes stop_codon:yes gene_type:complete